MGVLFAFRVLHLIVLFTCSRYEAAEKSAASFDINAVAMCHGIFDIVAARGAAQSVT